MSEELARSEQPLVPERLFIAGSDGASQGGSVHGLVSVLLGLLVGGLLVLIHTVPTSSKLARLEPTGPTAPAFAAIHRRLKISGMISSMIGLLGVVTSSLYQIR